MGWTRELLKPHLLDDGELPVLSLGSGGTVRLASGVVVILINQTHRDVWCYSSHGSGRRRSYHHPRIINKSLLRVEAWFWLNMHGWFLMIVKLYDMAKKKKKRNCLKKKKKWDVVIWINVIITRWLLHFKHDNQNIPAHSAEPANYCNTPSYSSLLFLKTQKVRKHLLIYVSLLRSTALFRSCCVLMSF